MDTWLSQSYRFQITNGDCIAGLCWWIAVAILVELPRVARILRKVCNGYEIHSH